MLNVLSSPGYAEYIIAKVLFNASGKIIQNKFYIIVLFCAVELRKILQIPLCQLYLSYNSSIGSKFICA